MKLSIINSILLIGISTVVINLLGCSSNNQDSQSLENIEKSQAEMANAPVRIQISEMQKQEIGLRTTKVIRSVICKSIESPGQVQANAELSMQVSTPSPGRVVEVKAKLGDTVQIRQIMAVIKSDPIAQVQSDLLQNVLQAKADIKQQEVGLKLDRITFERESILYKDQVSAKADLQIAQNQLEKDEANLAALKAKLAAYIEVAQQRLTWFGAPANSAQKVVAQNKIDPWVIIRAPRNGLVTERTINPGELTDGSKALFTVTDLSQVWLIANVFEKDIALVKKGQEATVSLDDVPEHPFPAKIVWLGDSLNPTTRTLPVRANVSNPDYILHPNMFARIKINIGQLPVLLVPRSSVIQKGDRTLVFVVVNNGLYEERDIKTGTSDSQDIQIKDGLVEGDEVVSQGATELLGTAMKTARIGDD